METTNTTAVVNSTKLPTAKDLLDVGAHFGHESHRWNPKMSKYIYSTKNKIHIIDVHQTEEYLKKAVEFLTEASSKGAVIFVGTKKQASDIVKEEAIRSGSYFVSSRWAGGILTNFGVVKRSLNKLANLELSFEQGVQDRTKYEISVMKKEWERLNRLYQGIKNLSQKPVAMIVVDTKYESSAIREAKKVGIPVIAIVDTNCDPDLVDYAIPANDDAIGSIKLIMNTLAEAVLAGNKGNGIKHNLVDYNKVEVKIMKNEETESHKAELVQELKLPEDVLVNKVVQERDSAPSSSRKSKVKGILEIAKEKAEKSKKEEVKPAKVTKKVTKK